MEHFPTSIKEISACSILRSGAVFNRRKIYFKIYCQETPPAGTTFPSPFETVTNLWHVEIKVIQCQPPVSKHRVLTFNFLFTMGQQGPEKTPATYKDLPIHHRRSPEKAIPNVFVQYFKISSTKTLVQAQQVAFSKPCMDDMSSSSIFLHWVDLSKEYVFHVWRFANNRTIAFGVCKTGERFSIMNCTAKI